MDHPRMVDKNKGNPDSSIIRVSGYNTDEPDLEFQYRSQGRIIVPRTSYNLIYKPNPKNKNARLALFFLELYRCWLPAKSAIVA